MGGFTGIAKRNLKHNGTFKIVRAHTSGKRFTNPRRKKPEKQLTKLEKGKNSEQRKKKGRSSKKSKNAKKRGKKGRNSKKGKNAKKRGKKGRNSKERGSRGKSGRPRNDIPRFCPQCQAFRSFEEIGAKQWMRGKA